MKLKILQIASFNGNIGDLANHNGFRNSMKDSGIEAEYTDLEIRDFYQIRGGKFDKKFVELANKHDLVVFGGGGFFQLKWDYSQTGTTLDLSEECLRSINTPVLFNCLGVSLEGEYNEPVIKKFKKFLDIVCNNSKFLLTVRNDDSYEVLNKLYGNLYVDKILKVPDGGFFAKCEKTYENYEIKENMINIGVNLAGDVPHIRYEADESYRNEEEFIIEFSEMCNQLLRDYSNCRLIFVPHIYRDLRVIYEVLNKLDDELLRTRVTCAGLYNGDKTGDLKNFDLYRNCDLVLGMRYHANVVPIGMNVPTIALATFEQIAKLYDNLGISHRCLYVNSREHFGKDLIQKITFAIDNKEKIIAENQQINKRLQYDNCMYMNRIVNWLNKNS